MNVKTTSVEKESIVTLLRAYIIENFLYDDDSIELSLDLPLIEQSIINSMGIMLLVVYLEETFGVMASPDELVIDNFATLDVLSEFVLTKQKSTV